MLISEKHLLQLVNHDLVEIAPCRDLNHRCIEIYSTLEHFSKTGESRTNSSDKKNKHFVADLNLLHFFLLLS